MLLLLSLHFSPSFFYIYASDGSDGDTLLEMSRPHVLLADSSLRHYDCRLLLPMLLLLLNSAASEASLSTTDIWWSAIIIIIIIVVTYYSAPDRRAEYCDDRVCVSVCLFASISPELHF